MALTSEQLASGILLAYTLFNEGRYQDTETLVEGLLVLNPDNAYLHSLLASTYHLQNKPDQAIREYTRAIELFPENISALVNRGELYLKQGMLAEAAKDLTRAAELDPKRENVSANRARLLMNMTSGALKLASEKGIDAVHEAQRLIEKQLKQS